MYTSEPLGLPPVPTGKKQPVFAAVLTPLTHLRILARGSLTTVTKTFLKPYASEEGHIPGRIADVIRMVDRALFEPRIPFEQFRLQTHGSDPRVLAPGFRIRALSIRSRGEVKLFRVGRVEKHPLTDLRHGSLSPVQPEGRLREACASEPLCDFLPGNGHVLPAS